MLYRLLNFYVKSNSEGVKVAFEEPSLFRRIQRKAGSPEKGELLASRPKLGESPID
jgi:hypothetical protein